MNKLRASAAEALQGIPDGATILAGGFGLCGIPEMPSGRCASSGSRTSRSSPTTAASTTSASASCCEQADPEDDLELRRREQGVRAPVPLRRARGRAHPRARSPSGCAPAAPASPRSYTRHRRRHRRDCRTARKTREFDGRDYVLERGITGDFAIVKAWKGDRWATSSTGTRR